MSAQNDPKNKTFVVTGGASGLGALYVEWFLTEGAKSIAILDVAAEKGRELAARLNTTYPDKVTFYQCNVGDETQLSDVFNQVVATFGQVDVIINNAGVMVDAPNMWRQACDVNWQGLVSLTLKGVKHMRTDEGGAGGTIVNVSSTACFFKSAFLPIYSGSKIAVLHFTQSLAMDPFYEHTGVRVMVLCPHVTKTDLLEGLQYKAWDEKSGETLAIYATQFEGQKPESCANTAVKMFKEGTNGSIWLSSNDKPGEDITKVLHSAFESFEPLFETLE